MHTATLADEVDLFLSPARPERVAFWRDPYDFYARLRDTAPVFRAPDGRWIITGYDECDQMLKHREVSHRLRVDPAEQSLAHRVFMGSMLFRDAPEHTRLRRTVSRLFTPKVVGALRDRIARISNDLLEQVREADQFDLRTGPGFQLPVLVIADMLGVPAEDFNAFHVWAELLLYLDENPAEGPRFEEANRAAEEAMAYFSRIIAERRAHPGDDLISGLLAEEDPDARLTDEEIVTMCVILHIGGHSTTSTLLSNAAIRMTLQPEIDAALRTDISLLESGVEEFLRYDSPINVTVERATTSDVEIGGVLIPQGSVVHAVLAAANRDPRQFADPERFDLARKDNRHLAFASGNHFCIGSHLARLETTEFLRVLMTRFPPLRVAVPLDEVDWVPAYVHRGPHTLPVSWLRS